jgi:tRNA 2-thiouridine synthesizing protein A
MKRIVVVVQGTTRAAEALRAAVGLTLRGDRVAVVPPPVWPEDERVARALGVLRALGHVVDAGAEALAAADVVEVWTDTVAAPPPPPDMKWLVRTAAEPHAASAVVIDDTPPEILVDLLFAADRVAVWGTGVETLDLAGEICPFTFVRTKLRLEELTPGAQLRVIVDHEPATRNVPRSVTEWGQEVLGVHAAGPGLWEIWIRKS